MARTFLREGQRLVLRLFGVLGTRAVIVLCLLASASVAVGAWRSLWLGARGTAMDGVVVRQDEVLTADFDARAHTSGPTVAEAQRLFQAVVEFRYAGRLYHIRARNVASVHLYPLGSSQVVVFFPDRPDQALLRSELPDVWIQSSVLLMGTLIGAGALRWWWWLAKRRPRFRKRTPASAVPGDAVPGDAAPGDAAPLP